ncbi:MAG: PAS domain S-box protein [Parvibaculum sp.]|uniref:PAS domain-containing sensor histidine kinase n=1 Tax=Parvibaculum sp. TaxID=2024848 RepID=UPI002728EA40|nr:PAS domain S-box protein [Parvibaculum sp.]MDO8838264.1 PAS domain S-box protein [Parvibaculum sp.]
MDIDGKDDACGKAGRAATLPLSLSNDAARSMFVRLFEAAGDVILIFDARGRIEAANPALERILGYAPDEVRGRSLTMLVAPAQRRELASLIAAYAAGASPVIVGRGAHEIPVKGKCGEERFFEIVVERIADDGGPMFLAIARDVTERRQRDASLRSSEAMLRALLEFGTDIATVVGADGAICFESPFTKNILGYIDDDLAGVNALEFVDPDDRPRVEAALLSILAEAGKRTELEARFRHKDGTPRTLHLTGTNCLEHPAIGGIVINARDVTERVAAEEARETSDRRLHQAQKAARMAVWDIHLPTGRMSWSPESGTLFGIGADDRVAAQDQFFRHVHRDDLDGFHAALAGAVETRAENFTHEFRIRAAGGRFLHVRAHGGCIMDDNGVPLFLAGVAQDVTDYCLALETLRQSEARLTEAQRMAKFGHWELDIRTEELIWTDGIYEMFGLDREQFGATYEAFLDAVHPDDRDLINAAYRKSLVDRTPYVVTHRLRLADGTVKWVEERCATEFDAEGNPLLSRGTVQDITERKLTELAVVAARDEAVVANRAKSEFLANMSHELRTPLNAILGFSEMMQREVFGPLAVPKYREYVGDILKSGRHLLDVLSDIMDVSRVEVGKIDFEPEDISIRQLADACKVIVGGRIREKRQHFSVAIRRGAGTVHADPRLAKQVLLNLLSNALKFTPEGGRIELTARRTRAGEIALSVADTGIGIAPEDIARVVEPFVRVEGALARTHEGTGLGLALTKSFIELHGGRLEVESRLGEGTTVTVYFPAPAQARHGTAA